jgi:hypothetical protein
MYNSNAGFLKEEIEFLHQLTNINGVMSYRKQISSYVKESKNSKITEYF